MSTYAEIVEKVRVGRAQQEREDETLLVTGFDWREASSLTNERISTLYTIYGRAQLAADKR